MTSTETSSTPSTTDALPLEPFRRHQHDPSRLLRTVEEPLNRPCKRLIRQMTWEQEVKPLGHSWSFPPVRIPPISPAEKCTDSQCEHIFSVKSLRVIIHGFIMQIRGKKSDHTLQFVWTRRSRYSPANEALVTVTVHLVPLIIHNQIKWNPPWRYWKSCIKTAVAYSRMYRTRK